MRAGEVWSLRLGLVCAALALFALPATADAASSNARPTESIELDAAGPEASFEIKGTNGYKIAFSISNGFSFVDATNGSGSSVSYSLFEGSIARGRLHTNLGSMGIVSARFIPAKITKTPADGDCKGKPAIDSRGTFVGTIRFQGEEGFTRFASKRVRGEVSYTPKRICRFPKEPEHAEVPHHPVDAGFMTEFFAQAGDFEAEPEIDFVVVREESEPDVVEFNASAIEEHGKLSISRRVNVEGPASAFAFDAGLNSATIAPPAPFSGSATFTRSDDFGSRWFGPLTVSFPGRANVPLTGRAFSWGLNQRHEFAQPEGLVE